MYLGLDLGTSSVKAIIMNEQGDVVASHSIPLTLSRPHPQWSEQDPQAWWQATDEAIKQLSRTQPMEQIQAIGLSGQMHGAVLLDAQQNILRPAILWNDGRSVKQCLRLAKQYPQFKEITGNLVMPGFTAPKLQWVAENEAEIFCQIAHVLLPKDFLRWKMSGNFASDMSDAAGTLWLDMQKRDWSDELLAATGLSRCQMPTLFEGNQITGYLLPEIAKKWQMKQVPIIAGGGDNAAGAIGVGVYQPGQGMLSLGTSGVYFVVSEKFLQNSDNAVHSFCHALPQTWHLMSVILSAASCLDWVCQLTGISDVGAMFKEIEQHAHSDSSLLFLPYLSGERTPYNNADAKGVFWGLTHQHQRADLCRAVLEGVSFALRQGIEVADKAGQHADNITLIGGGARSEYWRQLLADITGKTLDYRQGGDVGPALGAARLAQLAINPAHLSQIILSQPKLETRHVPNLEKHKAYQDKYIAFKKLYTLIETMKI
ncbi:xylulokinase [Proteus mirabilis]|uniref:Xylulose kinase n=4 Tax=Proteus mirabilis TaxID=584 RepID=A0A2X2C4S7_PROMI|nr:xylulokinase [Proteus mirabilis]EKU0924952.1 xylulokinase [Proteus mirabilis]EKX8018510.1 xylulokinase [Proteus mirabilis]MBB6682862.1 xylulokinase [Proteus mirabilis]MBG2970252.1 xylulokinase [Proteus mirabilis]MBI6243933.1 xylulokinase [Proteus mirabilis]